MGSEAFYATAAQILPTLLIAISVEVVFMSRESLGDAGRSPLEFVPMACFVGGSFMLGEAAAVVALFFGPGGWIAWATGPIVLLTLLLLCAYAAVVPLAQLRWQRSGSAPGRTIGDGLRGRGYRSVRQ